jgi:aryl-alcohol dehydrogenase-like predicted oxidoreductase
VTASLAGRATPEGTRRYASDHPAAEGHYRATHGLTVSGIGVGTYLGDVAPAANAAYEDAVLAALERGVNVVDTAINYRNQQSERDVGRALARFGRRDQVVVATKGGFLAGDAGSDLAARDYVRREYLESGLLKPEDVVAGAHAMTAAYLRDQLQRSLRNLGLEAVDVYFVHNPETQLQAGVSPQEFEARLQGAFEELERQCDAGRIGMYGLATWDGFRLPPDAPGHLGLERVLELAAAAREAVGGGYPHLGAIQLPFNLAMPEALAAPTQAWQGEAVPFLVAAHEAELTVFASATLLQSRLLGRLPPYVREAMGASTDAEAAMEFARSAPGVTTALVGMGDPAHAQANADAMRRRPVRTEGVTALTMGG